MITVMLRLTSDDIESINVVLKGCTAPRASNGVVMIVEKGRNRKGLGVTISSSLTLGTADSSTLPRYQNKYIPTERIHDQRDWMLDPSLLVYQCTHN
jgi:hypothetical protein